jgi:sulfatase maturation enzyme AslB (radical SAM superfamily)
MLNDEAVPGCSRCYDEEKLTGSSMRTYVNSSNDNGLPEEGRGKVPLLTNIDLAFSNVCNNKCRMCGPALSTSWYKDVKKFPNAKGAEIPRRGVESKNTILEKYELTSLRFIKILGGEPLMEEEKLINLLEKCDRPNLKILINTNTTIRPSGRLLELFKELEKTSFILSVDAYGHLNDFLRKGSNWDHVESNIKWFLDTFGKDVNIHSVISIYNVNKFNEMIEYCENLDVYYDYTIVDGPDWMMPRNLPIEVKQQLIEKYKNNSHNAYKMIINELSKDGSIDKFKESDILLNQIRSENWKDLNPWLYEVIYAQ